MIDGQASHPMCGQQQPDCSGIDGKNAQQDQEGKGARASRKKCGRCIEHELIRGKGCAQRERYRDPQCYYSTHHFARGD